MKTLVISDIHANLPALEAVFDHCGPVDAVWCLGDLVGYGPDPNECVERIRAIPNLFCILGNHDSAALGQLDLAAFNFDAQQSTLWTQLTLSQENKKFLLNLPETRTIGQFTLAHGSPHNPIWEYVLDTYTARVNFQFFNTSYCLIGHSHLPLSFIQASEITEVEMRIMHESQTLALTPRAILNPGSVGQPRDHDSRASYAILDTETLQWELKRVHYPYEIVQERIRRFNLPDRHALRLAYGW